LEDAIPFCDLVFHALETDEANDCGHKGKKQQGRAEDKSMRLV
jgi:hypothetical protein